MRKRGENGKKESQCGYPRVIIARVTTPTVSIDGKERETIDESFKAANIPAQRQNLFELKDSVGEPETSIQIGIIRFRWDEPCNQESTTENERRTERERKR